MPLPVKFSIIIPVFNEAGSIGTLISEVADVLDGLAKSGEAGDPEVERNVRQRVEALCDRFPIYED